jgi:signal transduction histidine kinase
MKNNHNSIIEDRSQSNAVKMEQNSHSFMDVLHFLAILAAAVQAFGFHTFDHWLFPPGVLFGIALANTLFIKFIPLSWYKPIIATVAFHALELAVCIFLILATDGLNSPFLLYTLLPVVRSALFLEREITFGFAVFTAAYVILIHLFNPFFTRFISQIGMGYYFVYVASVLLSGALPYLVNFNLRQLIQNQDILKERQRISHELHDGTVQTVSALRWQIQLLHRRMQEKGLFVNEMIELETLADKAQHQTRESLDFLRNFNGDGSFLPYFKDYIEHLQQQTNIEFHLSNGDQPVVLGRGVEYELLRICQEVLTNINKHAGASEVKIAVQPGEGHLKVSIVDNGCGFNISEYDNGGHNHQGQGIAVMQERASAIGGKILLSSTPGRGTEVLIEVPAGSH